MLLAGCADRAEGFIVLAAVNRMITSLLQRKSHALLHVNFCSTCDGRADMYKRDVAVVIVSFLALFLCLQHEGNFSFRKAWWASDQYLLCRPVGWHNRRHHSC